MTHVRWSDEEDALREDLAASSANEQLLRYVGMRDSSVADTDSGYLLRADTSYLGTDFP